MINTTQVESGSEPVYDASVEYETERLSVLKYYRILDTPPEEIFDDIVKVAATSISAPIALITLIDNDRQWFKAKFGVDMAETARAASFCSHTIKQKSVLAVADLTLDDRFKDNPFVCGAPHVRFYAGAPLTTPEGYALGSVCVLDYVPRVFQDSDVEVLARLSRLVMAQLELRRDFNERIELTKDLTLAHQKLGETSALLEKRFAQRTQALRVSENRFRTVVEGLEEAILITGFEGTVLYANVRMADLTDYDPEEILGLAIHEVLTSPEKWNVARERLKFRENRQDELWETSIKHKDGTEFWAEVKMKPYRNEDGEVVGTLYSILDISERKRYQEELTQKAFFDTLTGLPNRALFLSRLDRSLEGDTRLGKRTGLIFIDLDNFKIINDSLGHDAGDELLVGVGDRLQMYIESKDTLARLGGDEFVILLDNIQNANEANLVAEKVTCCLQSPLPLRGRNVFTSASIGVAVSSGETIEAGGLLRQADIAMYRAKSIGKGTFYVFDKSMNAEAQERLELEGEMRTAIDDGQMLCHYQPILEMQSGLVIQIEALVRWQHPVRGLLGPGKFISLAEETGLIVPLGLWVLESACREASTWDKTMQDWSPLIVCVNLSTRQFRDDNLVAEIGQILRRTNLPAGRLKLEITESLMMDSAETIQKLNELKAMGVQIAVDDFGTGYSSMSYLGKFPVDTLKIDQSFTSQLGKTSDAHAIIEAMIMLGKALGMRVTCEGVETHLQHNQLRELGCDNGQGYYYSRPVPAAELRTVIQQIASRVDLCSSQLMAA